MGRLLVVMPDEVIEKLREVLPAKRGAISQFVREAVIEKLEKDTHMCVRREHGDINKGKRGGRKRS